VNSLKQDAAYLRSSNASVNPHIHIQTTVNHPEPPRTFRSRVQHIFKALGLSAGFNLLAKVLGWPVYEDKKVVMQRSRPMATLRCAVHLVPIAAAISLLVLNGSNHYIGGELSGSRGQDSQKLGALLFAAKLHELFMLASLSAIVISYVRKELAFGEGVPFGTVFSASQFKDLTFLWSPELWGSIYQEWQKSGTKWFTVSLLIVCSVTGLVVGPSTGNLMRPRLDEWPAGGTTFWIGATEDQLRPQIMQFSSELSHCTVDNDDLACPASGWQVFDEQYFPFWKTVIHMGAIPQALYASGRSSLRQFTLRTRNLYNSESLLWANAFTLASVPPSAVADALVDIERLWINAAANGGIGNYKYRRDASFTTEVAQPLVLARCSETGFKSGDTIKLLFPSFRNVTLSNGPESATGYGSTADYGELHHLDDKNTTSQIEGLLDQRDLPSLYWIENAESLQETNASMLVVATFPSLAGPAAYYGCSIDSRFAKVTLQSLRSSITQVSGSPKGFDDHGTFDPTYQHVKLTTTWAQYLNPLVSGSDSNKTVFSTLASTAGVWSSTPSTHSQWFPVIVENILAILVANGIGRASFNTTLAGILVGQDDPSDPWSMGDWVRQILPSDGRLGKGGNAFQISEDDKSNATQFVFEAKVLGYAYSPQGKTQIAAMVVLSVYVLLVLCHIGYTAATGWYTSDWGSPSELTALAMNSHPTSKLKNTGGGIETIQVFREQVKIRVMDNRLQFVFDRNEVGGGLEPGKAYA
jgi:hypothetical protein